jgi:nucleoside-diphosphate-sugar epimerase
MKVAVFGAEGFTGRAILANMKDRHEVHAVCRNPEAWQQWSDIDGDWDGLTTYGDIVDYEHVDAVVSQVEGIIHTTVYFAPGGDGYSTSDEKPFLVNLKGLWNVLQCARLHDIRRVVHIGSCGTVHPDGVFFDSDIRRPDGELYGITKRLQEEMCRQFYDAFKLSIIVLRPDYIVDTRIDIGRHREEMGGEGGRPWRNGLVCRHDLAEACRLAIECDGTDFDILHAVGTKEAEEHCNVGRTREVLGLEFRGDLDKYRS